MRGEAGFEVSLSLTFSRSFTVHIDVQSVSHSSRRQSEIDDEDEDCVQEGGREPEIEESDGLVETLRRLLHSDLDSR